MILASGIGLRIGGPKALLLWNGMPLAVAHARARDLDCDRVIVVTREPIARVLLQAEPRLSIVISHQDDALGPAGSIAAAARSGAIDRMDQLLLTPVDVAPASTQIVEVLFDALRIAQASRPRLRGLLGHPVAVQAGLIRQAYRHHAAPLRDLMASLGSDCIDVDVDDQNILGDFDTIEAFEATTGRRLDFWR